MSCVRNNSHLSRVKVKASYFNKENTKQDQTYATVCILQLLTYKTAEFRISHNNNKHAWHHRQDAVCLPVNEASSCLTNALSSLATMCSRLLGNLTI